MYVRRGGKRFFDVSKPAPSKNFPDKKNRSFYLHFLVKQLKINQMALKLFFSF